MNQRGFATLEVILMITVLGILSAVAIPRFTSVTTSANTAKVQADLSALDTAISLYQMDNGSPPTELNQLGNYIQGIDKLKPPKGKVYREGTEEDITATSYEITSNNNNPRATLDSKTSEDFYKNSTSTSSTNSSTS